MSQSELPFVSISLFDELTTKERLATAFKAVRANRGAAGIDGISIETFEARLDEELGQLVKELKSWTYEPKPVRRVDIPKASGGTRMLGIACVRDRVVQAAIKALIEPILDPTFSEHSYGFRPGRNQKQAVEAAQKIVQSGKQYVVDLDLENFFNRINHDKLIGRLTNIIADKRILRLIGTALRSGIMHNGVVLDTTEGAPQGSPLSPLLSNVVLDELDKELERRGLEFCRFADDANIFVKSKVAAERAMENVSTFIERRLKLVVNREKSKVALTKAVKFLGMTIINGAVAISLQTMNRAMAKTVELTPRGTHLTLEKTIERINSWYMGWSEYYKMTQYPSQLSKIEAHIRRRLRSRIVGQQKRRRHLLKKMVKRGVPRGLAGKTVHSNRGRWALAHSKAMEMAFPNSWFANAGLTTRSGEQHPHWFSRNIWIRLT